MAWYDESVFYHIYPLGLCDAPKQNDYGEPVHRLPRLLPWIDHIRRLGFTALYIGPLFQSVGHGYETTDYRLLDARLGTNEDLKEFVSACHAAGIRVIFDGVFNHTGRDFFAFKDLQANRENSAYRDWYCNVNFWGDNEYHDGFSYDNWGGYNLLVKLNQWNPAVRDYICDVIRFWVSEFDVDGLRLDAADVLDFEFMKALRQTADEVKPDFWLMGEVIHGDYSRWANGHTLHSVTDYALHKALYSSHNDHNYFELAHTVARTRGMIPEHIRLYNFVDNHDVERISTKLVNKAHLRPVHILLYTLPGIPSVYYGGEFGIEGRKEQHSDDSLRPYIDLDAHADDLEKNPCTSLIAALGEIHNKWKQELVYGDYRQLLLTNQQFAFARGGLIVAVNNSEEEAGFDLEAGGAEAYVGLLSGERIENMSGRIAFTLPGCGGEIFAPEASLPDERRNTESQTSIRAYTEDDMASMIRIWNEVVEEGIAFPQEDCLDSETGRAFFASQSYTGVAEEDGKILGLYILHPNNEGRCGHICNASFAVAGDMRGRHIGEQMVLDCMKKGRELGFRVLQFNAVVESNLHARHLYERLGFTRLGTIPGGFRMKDGHYESICPYYCEL